MLEMLRAHGLDAGPTQRPALAGTLSGALAAVPALLVMLRLGSLSRLAAEAGVSLLAAGLLQALGMALAGAAYGLLFRRAANDRKGGWLFGTAFGYLVWQAVAVPLLQWLPGEPRLQGRPVLGLLIGYLVWGLVMGLAFKPVHRPLQGGLDKQGPRAHTAGWR